jgi:DNA topoisomerase I
MGKKLVIVESPAKAKTINRMLGKDYVVKSSMGHVRDLPVRNLGVDIKNDFKPKYVVVKTRRKVVEELKKTAKDCDAIYLAPDPDREGEAIAWHLRHVLDAASDKCKFYRVQYNEITPRAVRGAFENPGEIDLHRVDAQQARRVLDRIVGYMVSPMLWREIKRGLSAGRVQSVALRLVCDREKEIRAFVPEEYWIMGALVRKLVIPLEPFTIKLVRIGDEKAEVKSWEQAEAIRADLEGRSLRVKKTGSKDVSKRPPPPYITSTLQQAASSKHGFSPKRTMSIAQKLYEGVNVGQGAAGLITYMRTDSLNVSRDALDAVRKFVGETYGEKFCPEKPNFFKSRKSAQEAHEAIRPTDVTRTPESVAKFLDAGEKKLYGLVWRRFVASQMSPAVIEQRSADVETATTPEQTTIYTFRATASEVKFPGYMKVTGTDIGGKSAENGNGEAQEVLPALNEGEPLACVEWLSDRKETKPPARFSEASLVRALENNGVGRPSTYAQTISTLQQRNYVTRVKRTLEPTKLGEEVIDFLVAKLGELFDVGFTARMEDLLDEVENGDVEWTKMLADFYTRFDAWMENAKAPPADTEAVRRALGVLSGVQEWAPEVKRGRRKFSDSRFVESIGTQLEEGEKPVSVRQFEALLRIACRYREQVPQAVTLVEELGYAKLLTDPQTQKPLESTELKLGLLRNVELDEKTSAFVESIGAQVAGGRRLSDAQVGALDSIVVAHSKAIDGFEEKREHLALNATVVEDNESGPLLEAMSAVTEWKPPVKKGRRVFDDKVFYESLSEQFERRKSLSPRQRGALKRLCGRYRSQIPDFDALAATYGLRTPKGKGKRKPDGESESAQGGESKGSDQPSVTGDQSSVTSDQPSVTGDQ